MSWTVTWEPKALNEAAGFLQGGSGGLEEIFAASDALAQNPAPAGSIPWGSNRRRLRIGRWRILYLVDVETHTVLIEHVGKALT